jgi:hypothetical protein
MKYVVHYCLATLCCCICSGCEPPPFVEDMHYDLGVILVDDDDPATNWARHSFVFRNPSATKTAKLSVQSKSCGCTDVTIDKIILMPGDETNIALAYQLRNEHKVHRERALVATGIPESPRIVLALSAETVPRLAVSPSSLQSVELFPGETKFVEISAIAHRHIAEPRHSIDALSLDRGLILKTITQKDEAPVTDLFYKSQARMLFSITDTGERSPHARIAKYEIAFGSTRLVRNVYIEERSFVRAVPTKLYMTSSQPQGKRASIRILAEQPFSIAALRTNVPWLSFAVDDAISTTEWVIQVELIGEHIDAASNYAELVIDITHPRQEQVVVPIAVAW